MVQISVIIPAYNVEKYIERTIQSLLFQWTDQLEVIVIDDGSSDNTLVKTQQVFQSSDIKNYKIISKENGGVSSARNRGIEQARGQFLYFLDADDYVSQDWFSTLSPLLDDTEKDVIAWGYDVVDEKGTTIEKYSDNFDLDEFESNGLNVLLSVIAENNKRWIWTGSAIYRRAFIIDNNLQFTLGCKNGEDLEFIFKSLQKANTVLFVPEVLSFYVERIGSISNSYNVRRFDAVEAIQRVIDIFLLENNKHTELLVESLTRYMVDNYLANYHSCILNLSRDKSMNIMSTVSALKKDINQSYPGLIEKIKKRMKKLKQVRIKKKVKYALYLSSPTLYIKVVNRLNKPSSLETVDL